MGKKVAFTYGKHKILFDIPPSRTSISEHTYRLIDEWQLPIYLYPKLEEELRTFFNEQCQIYADETSQSAVEPFIRGNTEIKPLLDHWLQNIQEWKIFSQYQEKLSDEDIFSTAFQNVIHSGSNYEILLQLEFEFNNEIEGMIKQRDKLIQDLDLRHSKAMHEVVNDPTNKYSGVDVRNLAQKQMEEKQLVEGRCNSDISRAKDRQIQNFRERVMLLNEENTLSNSLQLNKSSKSNSRRSAVPSSPLSLIIAIPDVSSHQRRLETSYTVQLGAQLKSMYNLRLIRCNVLDYCRLKTTRKENKILVEPQRLQTLMTLYSSSLCGLVLLVPKRIRLTKDDVKEKFAMVCERSTDFHFSSFEQQLSNIEECLGQVHRSTNHDEQSLTSKNSNASNEEQNECSIGDFYVTRHSNLSEVHIVYHLVLSENVVRSSSSSEITSRHPAIFGLRNILKECCKHDVTTLTLPLLLSHDMTEEMTIPWVMKRTELILKCLKGFMMEMGTWGTNRCSTIQLVVPENLLDQTFFQLADLVPTIFRESRTVTFQH